MGGGPVNTKDNYGKWHGGDLIDMGMGAGAGGIGGAGLGFSREHIDMEHIDGGMILGREHYLEHRGGLFDGMALSSEFLGEYYSSVST